MKLTVRGVPVHYLDEGEGRPVLVLHGRPGDHRGVSNALERVFAAKPGWRRIYPDFPGMGLTPGADWIRTHQDTVDLVVEFADALLAGEHFALVGSSYGGYIALGVVRQRAARLTGVALWVPAVDGPSSRLDLPEHRVFERDAATVASVLPDEQLWLQVATVQTAETLARFRSSIKPGLMSSDMPFLEQIEASDPDGFDATDLPVPVTVPALLIGGRQDSLVGYAGMVRLLESFPRATLAVLDRAGHPVSTEQRVLFEALVGEWLDRVEETIPSAD